MAWYFFDTFENGQIHKDKIGSEFDTPAKVRLAAMQLLPAIAEDEVPLDGDRQSFTVLVKDENGTPVYSATLSFAGLWLQQ